jgi:hypothetical protein
MFMLSMGKSERGEKLPYSRGNLERMAGKIRPLSAGNILYFRNSLSDDINPAIK